MVLVGRVPEVVALDRLRAAAAAGEGGAALIVGEAGIGKSTLVEEAVARAVAAGATVRVARAVPDEGAPAYWPWLRLLEDVPGLSPQLLTATAAEGESQAAVRFRVAQRTVRALREAGHLVLVLEDLHWADAASIALLRMLCRELPGSRLLVIGTLRPPVPLDDLPAVEVLRLEPWEAPAVGAYLTQEAGPGVHGSWPAVVHRLSGGNPLYVRELTRQLSREDRLRRPAGRLEVPAELRRLVGRRTAQLSADCRELLGGAAALGAEIDVAVLRTAASDPDAVDGLLAEALDAGVLTEDPWRPALLAFAHDLVRRARYDELSRGERIAWHQRLADALATAGAAPADIARHRVRAAVDARSRQSAVDACRAAATAATRALDYAETIRWQGHAVELADDPADRLARATAAYAEGRLDLARSDCAAVLDSAERDHRADLAVEAALVVRGVAGELGPALLLLCERALAVAGRHPRVLAQYAYLLADSGDVRRAREISAEAMALAELTGSPDDMAAAVHARHQVTDPFEQPDEVVALAERSCALGRPDAELWGRTWRIDAYLMAGDRAAADAETLRLDTLAQRLGWPLARWHLLRARATGALLAGRLTEAEQLAAEAREVAHRMQDPTAVGLYYAFLAGLSLQTGQAAEYVAAAGRMSTALSLPIAAAQLGRTALDAGAGDMARLCWQHLRPKLDDVPAGGLRVYVLVLGGELAAGLGDLDTARTCYDRTARHAGVYLNSTTNCHGAAARALGVIASRLGEHDTAVGHLDAAITMEAGSPPFLAQAQLAQARALIARAAPGDRRRARDLATAAAATGRRLGMIRVAAGAQVLVEETTGVRGGAGALTARESEIAALVADGLANRAIAERLVLSERTVETHVRNLLAKLGLSNRTQVASWLRTGSQRQY
ncbi:AAA family ATPase [Actinoplanes sp. NPDC048967]|uniref:ATP-binding protein n=1 Tax=Actinoplanes sp. NPDC048967 TaxID=3155269 RepID=UPI0033D71033